MKRAVRAKFTQNRALREYLLSTYGHDLIESAPDDGFLGSTVTCWM